MRKLIVLKIALIIAAAGACSSAGGTKKLAASSDADADADVDTDADADTDTETETASEGEWCDEETELCWQNPPENVLMSWYHAAGEPHITLNPNGAIDYCGDLVWAGHSSWRLPEIDELIGLLRGCDWGIATGDETGSSCGVSDPECLDFECYSTPSCQACEPLKGPDNDPPGCYWAPELQGPCPHPDPGPPAPDPRLAFYWSSSPWHDNPAPPKAYSWLALFSGGTVSGHERQKERSVRCVRDGSGSPDDPD